MKLSTMILLPVILFSCNNSDTKIDTGNVQKTEPSQLEGSCMDVISLDKMNVFYIGVDNPIRVSAAMGWDRTSVTITGGVMNGSGSYRVVRVTEVGPVTITLSAGGRSTVFNYRVKRIPDPVVKLGPSAGGRMTVPTFKNQQFLRAEMENFDFDARFSITAATVYFMNPGDKNARQGSLTSGSLVPVREYMDQVVPGSTVTFDNIKVIGPDGQVRLLQGPVTFLLF